MIENLLHSIDDHLIAFIIVCIALGWAIRVIFLKGKDPDALSVDLEAELLKFEHWKRDRPDMRTETSEAVVEKYLDEK